MQKTQTIANKCGKRGDEGKERHHIYGSGDGPPDSNMKKLNESRPPEVGTLMRHNLFPAKSVTSIGTWNVRFLYKTGGLAQLIREMRNYDLQILGTGENTFELKWTEGERLTDLDFADNIALLDNTWDGIKQLTERVQTEAARVGLAINPDKTKVMKIGKWQGMDRIVIEEVTIEEVEDFCFFLVIDHKFGISPLFSLFQYISPPTDLNHQLIS